VHRRSRFLVVAIGLLMALALADKGTARRESFIHSPTIRAIKAYRLTTWHWQRVMGIPPSPVSRVTEPLRDPEYQHWVLRLWQRRAQEVAARARHVPHRTAWLCIHHYEGAWSAHTGNGYYGGLQMDITFMRHYGGYLLTKKGTAEHWTPLEQMWVAEHALQSGRGFYPWPHTARACGLI
jgi:hypothetical protein